MKGEILLLQRRTFWSIPKKKPIEQIGYTSGGLAWSIFRHTMVMDTIPAYARKGKPFIIGSQPHRWSWIHAEAVDKFNQVFYPGAIKAKPTPFWLIKLIAIFAGSKLKYAISIFKYFENHPEEGDASEANQLLGIPQIGILEFLDLYRKIESN